jgi:hypothetical protein
MYIDEINLRRLFRNRFELFVQSNKCSGANILDGSKLTVRDVSEMLLEDKEPFPLHYHSKLSYLCKDPAPSWLSNDLVYGDVAKMVLARLNVIEGQTPPLTGHTEFTPVSEQV